MKRDTPRYIVEILRFSNEEIHKNIEYVLERIAGILAPLPSPGEGLE